MLSEQSIDHINTLFEKLKFKKMCTGMILNIQGTFLRYTLYFSLEFTVCSWYVNKNNPSVRNST